MVFRLAERQAQLRFVPVFRSQHLSPWHSARRLPWLMAATAKTRPGDLALAAPMGRLQERRDRTRILPLPAAAAAVAGWILP
ncbi:hypothetical protein, partial [Mesorhizobium sp.]|uniref:hypothetical protein n=1 Tax=Mesorhizobium sp. TaxID=1871066 RepID=UPI0025BB4228